MELTRGPLRGGALRPLRLHGVARHHLAQSASAASGLPFRALDHADDAGGQRASRSPMDPRTSCRLPPHRGDGLSDEQRAENRAVVHRAWKLHYQHVRDALYNGFYQGWDLHPAQLPTRYAAVYSFFLEGLDARRSVCAILSARRPRPPWSAMFSMTPLRDRACAIISCGR